MYFSYTYAPNLTHQGAFVTTEISSANSYRNSTSPKHLLVHPWPKNSFPKGTNYTTGYKISMHSEYTGSVRTCASRKCRKSAHVPNVSLWMKKIVHTLEQYTNDSIQPPTHFWFSSKVDLTPKSELNPSGGLVKDLKGPLVTLKTSWIMPQIFSIKRGHGCTIF
jgi:hypothetical protein